jgi:uncharacterized LabA/DUF88 family protein
MKKERVFVFIDGFNLYHAVIKHFPNRYKWCDLRKLTKQFVDNKTQELKSIYFFTAYCSWDNTKKARHKKYIKALQYHCGVYSVLGKYRKVNRKFNFPMKILKCVPESVADILEKLVYETHEEKETDVNMALKILEDGFLDKYDHAFILSGDSDLIGAIKSIKKHFPDKKFTSLLPQKAKGKIIRKACNYRFQITAKHFEASLLPEEIKLNTGEVLNMPESYHLKSSKKK